MRGQKQTVKFVKHQGGKLQIFYPLFQIRFNCVPTFTGFNGEGYPNIVFRAGGTSSERSVDMNRNRGTERGGPIELRIQSSSSQQKDGWSGWNVESTQVVSSPQWNHKRVGAFLWGGRGYLAPKGSRYLSNQLITEEEDGTESNHQVFKYFPRSKPVPALLV